jgi:hypothetical protein
MHNGALRKWALALTFWLAVQLSSLRATPLPLGPYGTSPITFGVDANGLLSDTGTFEGTDSLSLSGAGTRMFWDPYKAAFRAGYVNGTQWNDANIGNYSLAFGINSTASGYASAAIGGHATASGVGSTATGQNTTASGNYSTAMGGATDAAGQGSTAIGLFAGAVEGFSTALGYFAVATGPGATALGFSSTASGAYSTALGTNSTASGSNSFSLGTYSTAQADLSFVIGVCNVGGGSSTSWVGTDPLFEVGNGGNGISGDPALTTTSDALVVYKNGNVQAQGTIRCSPGGDLSMGSFRAGTPP